MAQGAQINQLRDVMGSSAAGYLAQPNWVGSQMQGAMAPAGIATMTPGNMPATTSSGMSNNSMPGMAVNVTMASPLQPSQMNMGMAAGQIPGMPATMPGLAGMPGPGGVGAMGGGAGMTGGMAGMTMPNGMAMPGPMQVPGGMVPGTMGSTMPGGQMGVGMMPGMPAQMGNMVSNMGMYQGMMADPSGMHQIGFPPAMAAQLNPAMANKHTMNMQMAMAQNMRNQRAMAAGTGAPGMGQGLNPGAPPAAKGAAAMQPSTSEGNVAAGVSTSSSGQPLPTAQPSPGGGTGTQLNPSVSMPMTGSGQTDAFAAPRGWLFMPTGPQLKNAQSSGQLPTAMTMNQGSGEEIESSSRRSRGNYKCSKCGLPKKGHICEYQPRLRLRTGESMTNTFNAACQVEMDPEMVVRELDLSVQGTSESYDETAQKASAVGFSSRSSTAVPSNESSDVNSTPEVEVDSTPSTLADDERAGGWECPIAPMSTMSFDTIVGEVMSDAAEADETTNTEESQPPPMLSLD